jgi:hypothetical protein
MSTTAQDRTARTVRLVLLGTVPRAPLPERAPGPIAEAIAAHDPHVVGEFVTARDYWLGDTVLLGGGVRAIVRNGYTEDDGRVVVVLW